MSSKYYHGFLITINIINKYYEENSKQVKEKRTRVGNGTGGDNIDKGIRKSSFEQMTFQQKA